MTVEEIYPAECVACGHRSTIMAQKTILYIGASRGSGFYAYSKTAEMRKEVVSCLLVRNVDAFKSSEGYVGLSDDIKARTKIIQGSAHDQKAVKETFDSCGSTLEAVLFTVGFAPPNFSTLELIGQLFTGFTIDPPDLCARALAVVLTELHAFSKGKQQQPKLIVVSSQGITEKGHHHMPFILRQVYPRLIAQPHADKCTMEIIIRDALKSVPETSVFPEDKEMVLPIPEPKPPTKFLSATQVCVVRPSLLNDNDETGAYRVAQECSISGCYFVSRKDVGHFMSRLLCGDAEEYWGQQVVISN